MATPFPFTPGQTLTAAQMNAITTLPSTTKTASHTLVIADQGTRVIMNSASATSVTVNTSIFGAGDIVEIQNIGVGVATVVAGTATVSSAGPLAIPQNGGGRLVFSSASAATYFPTAVTASASGLTLIKTETITNGVSSVTVSSAFSSTFDNYKILVSGGGGGTAGVSLKLGATTTGYFAAFGRFIYNGGAASVLTDNNGSSFSGAGISNTNGLQMSLDVQGPNLAKNTMVAGLRAENVTTGGGGAYAGFLNDTTQYTDFTIAGTTFTGGTIKVYGYANS